MTSRTDIPTRPSGASATASPTDQDISDAYIYLLGRLLVMRQQQLDFEEGFTWNQLVHREPGGVDWPNPNLDVAYSEAWVAVDERHCVVIRIPKMARRYFTVQFLNGWGETLANINERLFPDRPYGDFAVCLKGADVPVPDGARRVDLPVRCSRLLARIELGADWNEAIGLQHQFELSTTGTPVVPDLPATPVFDLEMLPGVEAFDGAEIALESERDLNPGMERLQAIVRATAEALRDPINRPRIDRVIRERAIADMVKAAPTIGHGTIRNGWARPSTTGVYGGDYLTRTLLNYGGIWANTPSEVIYYGCHLDGSGAALHSNHIYTQTFAPDELPTRYATYFWSVIAVDSRHFRVLPNPMNRFLINNYSRLQYGSKGSLTLCFGPQKPYHVPDGNWLPTPKGQPYRLTFRFYGPRGRMADGSYYPPPLVREE